LRLDWRKHGGAPGALLGNKRVRMTFDEDLSIGYLETYSKTVNWKGFVQENNVMVIAGVYDARGELRDSYHNEHPFYAHLWIT
jgi:hypothetical protein